MQDKSYKHVTRYRPSYRLQYLVAVSGTCNLKKVDLLSDKATSSLEAQTVS